MNIQACFSCIFSRMTEIEKAQVHTAVCCAQRTFFYYFFHETLETLNGGWDIVHTTLTQPPATPDTDIYKVTLCPLLNFFLIYISAGDERFSQLVQRLPKSSRGTTDRYSRAVKVSLRCLFLLFNQKWSGVIH